MILFDATKPNVDAVVPRMVPSTLPIRAANDVVNTRLQRTASKMSKAGGRYATRRSATTGR